jgi:p-hydroxybenzoate 3-monooxygenase
LNNKELGMRTQVGIIGAGPAGLFLAHLLRQMRIDCIVLEGRSRSHVEGRVRAGVLERGTIETLHALGLDGRLKREGMIDNGLDMRFRGRVIHLNLPDLTGKSVMIYGQQEVVKDLIASRIAAGGPICFEAPVTSLHGLDGDRAIIRYVDREHTEELRLECDFIAGCDGYHGVSRFAVPQGAARVYDHAYDFAWLGVLARARPLADMTYSNSDHGFALCSRRSMEISRLYLQVGLDEAPTAWSDVRFWDELHRRMFDAARTEITEGEIFQRDVASLRCFVITPMQYGRLFLVGDAAHIVPPTGAKGMNLAVADARMLASGLFEFYFNGSRAGLDAYSERCLRRVWKTMRFSARLTELLHKLPSQLPVDRELQLAELEYIASSRAAQTSIAEQYVGLPYEDSCVIFRDGRARSPQQ